MSEKTNFERRTQEIQTAAAIQKAIIDYLFEKLPYPEYGEPDITLQTERVYEYVLERYAA